MWNRMWNTSLAAKGALAHRLQHRTAACKIQNGRRGPQNGWRGKGLRRREKKGKKEKTNGNRGHYVIASSQIGTGARKILYSYSFPKYRFFWTMFPKHIKVPLIAFFPISNIFKQKLIEMIIHNCGHWWTKFTKTPVYPKMSTIFSEISTSNAWRLPTFTMSATRTTTKTTITTKTRLISIMSKPIKVVVVVIVVVVLVKKRIVPKKCLIQKQSMS